MRYRLFGRTGLYVSELCFGAMTFGGKGFYEPIGKTALGRGRRTRFHGWARFESLQAHYTIATRDLERELVPLLNDAQMGLMVWSPLSGGLLSGKHGRDGKGPDGSRRAAASRRRLAA
jgi:aryl-alcohol dehydrogenase-like predicted oxidoreductase